MNNAKTRGRVIDNLLDQIEALQLEQRELLQAKSHRLQTMVIPTTITQQQPRENPKQFTKPPSAQRVAPSRAGPYVRRARDYSNVDFSNCKLGPQLESSGLAIKELFGAIKANKRVTDLNFHDNELHVFGTVGCEALGAAIASNSKDLKTLVLSSNALSDADLTVMLPGMKACSNIKELHLGSNNFTESSCLALAGAVSSWPLLSKLGLEGNLQIGSSAIMELERSMRDAKEI
jgi:hypothetical protein